MVDCAGRPQGRGKTRETPPDVTRICVKTLAFRSISNDSEKIDDRDDATTMRFSYRYRNLVI